jgi:anti-sigma regulatory factor (Ser/Thr protein kinase)
MNAMAPTRPTELHGCRVRLTTGPAAAAEARSQVRAAISGWDVPVDPGVAALLTSELVTNAIRHEPGETITLAITCAYGQLRVDIHDTSRSLPVLVDAPADAETGRGLMLVATLSANWGVYRTPAGKAVYFTLAFEPDLAQGGERGPQGFIRGDGESSPGASPSPANASAIPAPRLPRRNGAQGRLTGNVGPRMDVELLQDVGDVGRDGSPG